MIQYTAIIQRFEKQGEKTGWTYIDIPAEYAQKLLPGNKKSFRVKGRLDAYAFEAVSLLPMGEGNFIMPLNGAVRKAIKKQVGASLVVKLAVDKNPEPVKMIPELLECLEDEPAALAYWQGIPQSHRNYWIKWIETAKTDTTRTKRIAQSVNAMAVKKDFGQMLRDARDDRKNLLG
ncbi:DUF1905 domain-containing protein [Deminuibacter soli]|uniref:DUF1905 domain-containing protein n=2 Tax=Deminuibacter soli TaxID=2291815 RepID=A0A3E1NMH0_9BACT|nr:DUF1905 domain-containing protein [Deminuibacter soli]